MIDNYAFLSARIGESPSQFGITADSDTQPNYLNKRVMRIDAPHWLPPKEVADLYSVSEWSVSVKFTTPDFFIEGLEGTHNYTFKAGKATTIIDDGGEITTLTSDGPGWESVVDGINRKQYFDESNQIYIDGSIGTFMLQKNETVEIEDEILEETFTFIASLRVNITILDPRPMLYIENDQLNSVWIVDVLFSGDAFSRFEFDPEPSSPFFRTDVGTYIDRSGEPYQIGTVNEEVEIYDESIEITLSPASFHDSFHPL
jgi:hypothetical protein